MRATIRSKRVGISELRPRLDLGVDADQVAGAGAARGERVLDRRGDLLGRDAPLGRASCSTLR